MALALYRTYRPGSLSEVIGQEHVTVPLARALAAGRIHHAYLFSGPRGCGKTSTARILARSLNCEQGPTATPCGECRSCVELAPNGPGSIDVVELDAATHRGIDDARDLREKAIYAPAASRYKIYIIDEAHQLTNEAANALLKLVEEPPPHLRFVFATTEPDKIIPTIRSRTFHYGFRLVPARTLAEHLAMVCAAEGVPAESSALAVVARAGAGSVRDSLSVLGQLLAGAGPDGLTYTDAVVSLGLTDAGLIDAFVTALSAGSAAQMFTVVESVISAGHDPRRFVADVLDRLRDLIILRADPTALESGLLDLPDDAGERLLSQAQSLGLAELSRAADLVSAGLTEVKGATAPRLQLELLCARLALPGTRTDDLSALAARLERLERTGPPAVVPSRDRVSAASPERAAARSAGDESGPAPAPDGSSVPDVTETAARPAAPARREAAPQASSNPTRPAPPRRPDLRTDGRSSRPASTGSAGSEPAEPGSTASEADVSSPPAPTAQPAARTRAASSEAPQPAAQASPSDPARDEPVPPPSPVKDAPAPAGPPDHGPASDVGLSRVTGAWDSVLDRVAADSRVAWTAFHGARPVSLSQGVLAVAVSEPGYVRAIAQRGHDERLRQALIDVLGLDVTIDVVHDPDAASSTGNRPASQVASTAPTSSAGGGGASSGSRASSSGERGARLVREASAGPSEGEVPDEPSEDDPDLSGADGLALVARELGARPIGEIDHT